MKDRCAKLRIKYPMKCPYRDALRSEKTGLVTMCICRHDNAFKLFCNNDTDFPEGCPLELYGGDND